MSERGPAKSVRLNVGDRIAYYEPLNAEEGNSNDGMSSQYVTTTLRLDHEWTRDLRRSKGLSGLEIVEGLAALGELSLSGVALQSHNWRSNHIATAGLLQWTYVFLLVTVSLTSAKRAFPRNRLLKQHRAFLYGSSWLISVLVFRSMLIHPHSRRSLVLRIVDLLLNFLLLLISIASSNKAQNLQFYDESLQDREQPREPVASIISLATFMWVDPIIWRGYRKTYEVSDVWDLPPADKAAKVLAEFRQHYKDISLAANLLVHHGQELMVQGLWAVCSAIFTFAPTLLLKLLLEYLEDPSTSSASGAWLYVVLLFVSGFLKAVAEGQASWLGKKIAIHLRAIVVGEIFSKTLRRKATANAGLAEKSKPSETEDDNVSAMSNIEGNEPYKQATTGNVTNLMAVDSVKIANVTSSFHLLWASVPAELIIGITLLYSILGYASIAGLAIMVILIPIKIIIARSFSKVQARIMEATDARIQTTSELLQSIRVIKYSAYEDRFLSDVQGKRLIELQRLRRRFALWTLAVTLYNTTPVLITFFSFLIYTVVEQRSLTPSVAFPALSLFALLRIPLDKLAETLATVQEAMVSVHRVEEYLNENETDKYKQISEASSDNSSNPVGFQDVDFTWDAGDSKAFRMHGVTITFVLDELNIIIGSTGSGKTSLLLALIGEMDLLGGNINFPENVDLKSSVPSARSSSGSVAYCAQRA